MFLRCSSLPRFITCASSALTAKNPYNPTSPMATLGTAAHKALELHVNGEDVDLDVIAKQHGVKRDDLGPLYGFGAKAWNEIKEHFPEPVTEDYVVGRFSQQGLRFVGIDGHADVINRDGRTSVIADWKSGWSRTGYLDQMAGYAYCEWKQHGMPKSGKIITIIVWLRYGEIDVRHWTKEGIEQWESVLLDTFRDVGKHYGPGEACTFCPRQNECDARNEFLRGASIALVETTPKELTPEVLGSLYPKAVALGNALDNYWTALNAAIKSNGTISVGDGREAYMLEVEKQKIDMVTAFKVLKDEFGVTKDEYSKCATVSKSKVMKLIADKAADRQKGKDKARAIELLDEAGALTVTKYLKRQLRKIQKGENHNDDQNSTTEAE